MSITIKQNVLKYRSPTDGQYHGIDAISGSSSSSGGASDESIVALSNEVAEMKNALSGFLNQFVQLIPSIVFANASHNGVATVSAANNAINVLSSNYSITKSLSHCSLSNNTIVVNRGNSYTTNITTESGYILNSVTVIMGSLDITSTVYNNGFISIPSVTGNIIITAVASQSGQTVYSITKNITNCSMSNSSVSVNSGASFSSSISANSGYEMNSVAITMGGANITSSAYNSSTGTISIASVTGDVIITASANSVVPTTYTPQVIYSNYTATGNRFSTNNIPINFANGDYVEALLDTTTCDEDRENILTVGKNGTEYVDSYDDAVAFLFYKRLQSGVEKILLRVKDVESNVSVDKWVTVADLSHVTIRIDSEGVKIDGGQVPNITTAQISHLLSLGTYIIGARGTVFTTCSYDHITVYHASQSEQTTYSITKNLTNCSMSNSSASINSGESFLSSISANSGYEMNTVTVTMGGTNITSTAYNSGTGIISIASVTGNVVITASASATGPSTYTPQVIYSNYTATGTRFSTGNIPIDFANGDYVEAVLDTTTCVADRENILTVGENGTGYIESYDDAVAFLFYKRLQSGVDKILLRVKDIESNVSVDKWVTVADLSNVTIRIDSEGVKIDGTQVSGITAAQISHLLSLGTYIIGARCTVLTTCSYNHITVYQKN